MSELILLPIDLRMFDGEGAGDANGGSVDAGQSESGEVKATSADAGQKAAPDAAKDRESKRKAYMELINGEYKDIHTEESQRIIDKRFKDQKRLEKRVNDSKPILDMLDTRYGTNGDMKALLDALDKDTFFWSGVAEEKGGTEQSAKESIKMMAQLNAYKQKEAVEKWDAEVQAMVDKYPGYDIDAEMKDPAFRSMLKSGVPLEHIYKVLHIDEVMESAVSTAVADTEKRVTETIRAKGNRPDENGMQSTSGYVSKIDVSKLTREERNRLANEALRGKRIEL